MPDWIKKFKDNVLALAVGFATLAAGAAGWAYFGLFIPMSVEMHSQYHGHEQAIEDARRALNFANKVLEASPEGTSSHDEALVFRDTAQARLDALEGS